VEWQLACSDLGSVRRWLSDHGTIDGLVVEPCSSLQILDTYLDTDDWRIHRAGFALRVRSVSGKSEATLKSLHSASTEFADRRELSESLADSSHESIQESTGPVGSRVHAVSGAHALLPLFDVRTARQRFAVRRQDETQQLGEISLDETVISRPSGEPQTNMQRVEVEAMTESLEPLQSLVKTLQSDCALQKATDTKYSQGLKSVGLAPSPAPQFAPMAVDASMSILDVALANLRRHVSAWHLHEPGARLGENPEALHDLRLAARRLDATLSQFREFLPGALLRARPALKKVLRALGEARDLDVALEELDRFGRQLPESDWDSVEPLKQHLLRERDRARTRMLAVLDSDTVQKNLQKLISLMSAPTEASPASAAEPALQILPQLIRQRYRKVRKGAERLTPKSSTEAYHEVRRKVKRLRYALEAVAGIYGKPVDDMLCALRRWQEKLGAQQDAAVASRRLKLLAAASPEGFPAATLFLMGRLVAYHEGVAQARVVYTKSRRKVGRRWKKLRAKLEDMAANNVPEPADSAA
jgi:CHAD domain-containing protein